ncbi:DUF721 domain-containing protein [bacterium]|nr:MAG: DUF721 domain-containing protein [bacterium]
MDNIGKIVNNVLDERGWRDKVLEKMTVQLWSDVAGPHIAANVIAERFTAGTLYVRARSPQWTQEIHFHEPRLIASLNGRLRKPIVQKIRARVTMPPGTRKGKVELNWEDPTFPAEPQKREEAKAASKNDAAAISSRELTQEIQDPEMRDSLARVIAAVKRSQENKDRETE